MSQSPNASILQARGVGIRKRAEGLALRAEHPFTKDQIATVDAAARDALAWLQEPSFDNLNERLKAIDQSLQVQAKRLDDLEDLLGARTAAAGRKV
jgi:hypothetical protein